MSFPTSKGGKVRCLALDSFSTNVKKLKENSCEYRVMILEVSTRT